MTEQEPIKFVDAESYQGGRQEQLTFRAIALEHFKRISNFNCVEFRGGYWETRTVPLGSVGSFTTHLYVPDSREVYNGSVEYLHDVMLPYFDRTMIQASEKSKVELKNLHEAFREAVKKEEERNEIIERKYLTDKHQQMRLLFQELSKLLFRLKYLEGKTFEEEE